MAERVMKIENKKRIYLRRVAVRAHNSFVTFAGAVHYSEIVVLISKVEGLVILSAKVANFKEKSIVRLSMISTFK